MTPDSFGYGACRAATESRLPCSEAAVDDSALCRWHMKVARKMTRRLEAESKSAPAPRKKKVMQ